MLKVYITSFSGNCCRSDVIALRVMKEICFFLILPITAACGNLLLKWENTNETSNLMLLYF